VNCDAGHRSGVWIRAVVVLDFGIDLARGRHGRANELERSGIVLDGAYGLIVRIDKRRRPGQGYDCDATRRDAAGAYGSVLQPSSVRVDPAWILSVPPLVPAPLLRSIKS
jgi:hypothetical protein